MSSAEPRPVRFGILGAGQVAHYHVAGLRMVRDTEVVAVASAGGESARRFANTYRLPRVYRDWRELVAGDRIDAVIIASPDDTHAQLALASIATGKAVLVQKPLAVTRDEANPIQTAVLSGGPVSVSYMHRYFDEVIALRGLLARGELGRVLSVRIRNATPGPDWSEWFYRRDRCPNGVLAQLGIHGIDLLRHLFGPIRSVQATTATLRRKRKLACGRAITVDVPDHALVSYRMHDGVLVSHEVSWCEPVGTDRFRLEVYGDRAVAWLRHPSDGLVIGRAGQRWRRIDLPGKLPGEQQHADFVAQIRRERPPDGTIDDAVAEMSVLDAIRSSAKTGRRVEVSR